MREALPGRERRREKEDGDHEDGDEASSSSPSPLVRRGGEIVPGFPPSAETTADLSLNTYTGSAASSAACVKERKRRRQRGAAAATKVAAGRRAALAVTANRSYTLLSPFLLLRPRLPRYSCPFVTFFSTSSTFFVVTTSSVKGGFRCSEPWRAACRKRRRNRNASIRKSNGNCGGTSGMPGGSSSCFYSVSFVVSRKK